MSFKCGIVGLPNVGKSTLFNALTNSSKAQAANFPFCTIDPNVGIVTVTDERLNKLSKVSKSKKTINTTISFVDIAGLVKGASKGEGLGNPTPDSENNRHNIGFKIIDAINKKFGLSKQKPKFKGLLTTGNVGDQKVYAIKPLTFMNNSGICIRELIEYFKIDAEDVIVFHDDLDVEFGKIKAKFGGSDAGHNGIASIDKFIGKNYSRVRIGIGKPKDKMEVSDFVLQNFDEDEMLELEKITNNITDSISILIDKKLDLFSSTVNNK